MQVKKEKIDKLQKKLEKKELSLYEALQEDAAIDWFKAGHPAFLSMLHVSAMDELIRYIIQPGPPDNKMRSYKIPMIATQILSTPTPKAFDLCFMQDTEAKGGIVLGRLISYFQTEPNYVISGYVTRILINLMVGNAPRVLQFLIKNSPSNMLKALSSHSIADFLLKIIIVQDILINNHIKERIELFNSIIDMYQQNKQCPEILQNVNYILTESLVRLWTNKHKELGRFSAGIFRIVELVIEHNNLYKQDTLIVVIMKHLTIYSGQAPYLIVALYKKIFKQLQGYNHSDNLKTQSKGTVSRFSMKNIRYLQAINFIFTNSPDIIVKTLSFHNIFTLLLDYPLKYQWNSILLIQILKIFRATFQTTNQAIFSALMLNARFSQKMKDLINKQADKGKFGRGYSGFLFQLLTSVKQAYDSKTKFGQWIKNHYSNFEDQVTRYLESKKQKIQTEYANEEYKVIHDPAKPHFNVNKYIEELSTFFEETQIINKKYQERPLLSSKGLEEELKHQIENQNEMIAQIFATTQSSQNFTEEKKAEQTNE